RARRSPGASRGAAPRGDTAHRERHVARVAGLAGRHEHGGGHAVLAIDAVPAVAPVATILAITSLVAVVIVVVIPVAVAAEVLALAGDPVAVAVEARAVAILTEQQRHGAGTEDLEAVAEEDRLGLRVGVGVEGRAVVERERQAHELDRSHAAPLAATPR